jgi:hypothetical protein
VRVSLHKAEKCCSVTAAGFYRWALLRHVFRPYESSRCRFIFHNHEKLRPIVNMATKLIPCRPPIRVLLSLSSYYPRALHVTHFMLAGLPTTCRTSLTQRTRAADTLL